VSILVNLPPLALALRVAPTIALAASLAAVSVQVTRSPAAAQAREPGPVSFNADIRPILVKSCVSCHGGVKQLSGLSFVYRDQALAECESGQRPIVPGKPDESYLLERVSDPEPDLRMPPAEHGPPLPPDEIELLRRWIAEGASWEEHWAFVAPRDHALPAVARADWPRDPLDRFILARIESGGLEPAAETDRAAWLRRASLDLIGLPPTPEEYRQFAEDQRPDAYGRAADRLLASPHFGERWAAVWLDLARYSDTQGYEADRHRNIWPYRDWVIRALNADMPFDEFTVKQLAGDLLPDASLSDRLATAFHRNTQTNGEGGTDDEEFRTAAVIDRVSTTWEAWMGLTFRCAQCHDHPYDPIRNREFYQFFAVLNDTRDTDTDADFPLLNTPLDAAAWPEAQRLDREIMALRRQLFEPADALAGEAAQWRPLRASTAASTGQSQLVVRDGDAPGVSEVVATGTIPFGVVYTIELPLGDDAQPLTALRIDALPADVQAALKTAEWGFVLTRLRGELLPGDGAPQPLNFVAVYADDPQPTFDPEDSLRDNPHGWCDFTRQSHPRHAVFVVDKPVDASAGSRLKLTLEFAQSVAAPLCIRRARFAVSGNSAWTDLVNDPEVIEAKQHLAGLVARRQAMPHTDVPVMAALPASVARRTYTFTRGNWLDKDAAVEPSVPASFPPLPTGSRADRLAIARWIVAPENPLTARVLVNRLWQELFGVGIVETAEDFGSSGVPPSHPELLDHLALRLLRDHQWSIKSTLRDMVLSATYRQSNHSTPEKLAADPRNRLLARGPRTRLTAEMVRDQALVLSGRFSPKMYGPPVMPPQPDGVWRSAYNDAQWVAAKGDDRYRRAVYTYWKRTSGYPSMLTFDAPSRDVCVARRIATNTPLQALVTMNDPAYIELAQGLATRMAASNADPRQQIAAGYRWSTGQEIAVSKLDSLMKLYAEAAEAYDAAATKPAELGATRENYALAIVANAMLNLDEVLTK